MLTPSWETLLVKGRGVFPSPLSPCTSCKLELPLGFLQGVSGGTREWPEDELGRLRVRFESKPVLMNAVCSGLTNRNESGVPYSLCSTSAIFVLTRGCKWG